MYASRPPEDGQVRAVIDDEQRPDRARIVRQRVDDLEHGAAPEVFRSKLNEPNVFVSGNLKRGGVERTLSVGLEIGETKRRVLLINGEKVTLAAYLNAMNVFAYSAARLEIIRGTPEERRRFLDRGIASINPAYLEQLTRYTRVLRQRNALLGEIAFHRAAQATLDAWDNELMVAAAVVHRARAAYAPWRMAPKRARTRSHTMRTSGRRPRASGAIASDQRYDAVDSGNRPHSRTTIGPGAFFRMVSSRLRSL